MRTVSSFNKYNTYPIKEFIIVEDSADANIHQKVRELYPNYTLIFNEENIGLFASMDVGYSRVTAPYVFHSEDDWEYVRSGFIENSLTVLESDPILMQAWIRGMAYVNVSGMTIEPELKKAGNTPYYVIGRDSTDWWHGYCSQTGLRKMSAYEKIKPFTQWSPVTDYLTWKECKVGLAYHALGYKVATLLDEYAVHIGDNRRLWVW
jgi:GT2 family glycosyltransferase